MFKYLLIIFIFFASTVTHAVQNLTIQAVDKIVSIDNDGQLVEVKLILWKNNKQILWNATKEARQTSKLIKIKGEDGENYSYQNVTSPIRFIPLGASEDRKTYILLLSINSKYSSGLELVANIFIAGSSQVPNKIRIILPKKIEGKSVHLSDELKQITKKLSVIDQRIKEQSIEYISATVFFFMGVFFSWLIAFVFHKISEKPIKLMFWEQRTMRTQVDDNYSLSKEIKTDTWELRKSLDSVEDIVSKISNKTLTKKEITDLQRNFKKYRNRVESYLQKIEDENNLDEKLDELKTITENNKDNIKNMMNVFSKKVDSLDASVKSSNTNLSAVQSQLSNIFKN